MRKKSLIIPCSADKRNINTKLCRAERRKEIFYMMIKPPITELVEKTGNRYLLTIETAKRARPLTDGKQPLVNTKSGKEVSIAAEEIYEDKLNYIHTPDIGSI